MVVVWARFSDDWADQPVVLTLSANAFRTYVESVIYVARYATDGKLPREALRPDRRVVTELTAAGLWEPFVPGPGFYVTHWAEHVPPAADLAKARDAANNRQRRHRRGPT